MLSLTVRRLNFFQSIIGLIGKKHPEPVLIQARFGIHTFCLQFPIDVLVLEKQKKDYLYKIVKIKPSLSPNHIFFWNIKYNTILELPSNTISKYQFSVTQDISISPLA